MPSGRSAEAENIPVCFVRMESVLCHHRELFRMLQRGEAQVDIQCGPVEVNPVVKFHIHDIFNFCLLEPGIFFVRKEKLPALDKNPDAVNIHMGDFNRIHGGRLSGWFDCIKM